MKKLALLGAARPRYDERVKKIKDKCGYCWSGWSYKIHASKLKKLDEQINEHGFFYIYVHEIEHPEHEEIYGTGTGYVIFKLRAEEYEYRDALRRSPEPKCTPKIDTENPHRLYAKVKEYPIPVSRQKWNTYIDYDTGIPLSGRFPWRRRNADFGFIIDPSI